MHLCPFCNRRTINLLDDHDDDDDENRPQQEAKVVKQLTSVSRMTE